MCNEFFFRRLVGSRRSRSGDPSVSHWSSWTNIGNWRWGGNQRKLKRMTVVPTIRDLTIENRVTTRKSNRERENRWRKYTKVREGDGKYIVFGMWNERDRSCFLRPKKHCVCRWRRTGRNGMGRRLWIAGERDGKTVARRWFKFGNEWSRRRLTRWSVGDLSRMREYRTANMTKWVIRGNG